LNRKNSSTYKNVFFFAEPDTLVAQALYDFSARSTREVNFHKGDTIVLFKQVSNDWWKGSVRGQEGLIPDKYIMLKMNLSDVEDSEDENGSLFEVEQSPSPYSCD